MNIVRLEGLDTKLYDLLAPLVMNPAILRQNNNYPFKTTHRHVWYIAMSDETVVGFMPVKKTSEGNCIDNYYISGDDPSTIIQLLDYIVMDVDSRLILTALVHKRHVEVFKNHHFYTNKEWKNYDKMQYDRKN